MRSPITNGQAILCYQEREVEFRREKFTITEFFYKCQDTGEEFMTGELMEVSLKQVYDQYNAKHRLGTMTYRQLALQHHN